MTTAANSCYACLDARNENCLRHERKWIVFSSKERNDVDLEALNKKATKDAEKLARRAREQLKRGRYVLFQRESTLSQKFLVVLR
jgi:hypothetical protein